MNTGSPSHVVLLTLQTLGELSVARTETYYVANVSRFEQLRWTVNVRVQVSYGSLLTDCWAEVLRQ